MTKIEATQQISDRSHANFYTKRQIDVRDGVQKKNGGVFIYLLKILNRGELLPHPCHWRVEYTKGTLTSLIAHFSPESGTGFPEDQLTP